MTASPEDHSTLRPLKRVGVVALACAIGGSIWLGVIQPWLNWRQENTGEIQETSARIAQFREAARHAMGDTLQARFQTQIDEQYADDFVDGENDSIILADLQSGVGKIVASEGSDLIAARQLPVIQSEGRARLGLNLKIRGDIRSVMRILHRIEASRPLLFIESASLRLIDGAFLAAAEGADFIGMVADINVYGTRRPPVEGGKS